MFINLKSQTDLSGFYIVYEGSTNIEKPGNFGISHLMEHLMCRNFDHLQDDFKRDGIDWNAYTSSNEIVFYWTGLEEKLNKYRYKLVELMSGFDVTKKEFENERNIVLEEYMDAFNGQTDSHSMNLNRKLFNHYDPIGLKEDLENLKFMDCLNFFEEQYSKPSKIINVSAKKTFKDSSIVFSDRIINKKFAYGEYDAPLELNNDFKDKSSIIILSPIIESDFAYIHFINAMLAMGLNSPLYQEVREKRGLVYYIQCFQSRMNKQGIINISTQTSNKNVEKVIESIKGVIENPKKYLTQKRFDTIKESYLVRKKKEKINRYANVNKWINPSGWSVYDIINDLTLEQIYKVYNKNFNMDKFYISVDKQEFGKNNFRSQSK
jgi:predicted Zn-dependent peptidase